MKPNEDKMLEAVIMLNGNYCAIPIKAAEMENVVNMITEAVKTGMNDPYHFLNYNGFFVFAKYIVGFYFREPVASYQKKTMSLLEKAVENSSETTDLLKKSVEGGEEWKAD